MRSLIKPMLFWVARLGLFLSVVAWIVGQWWAWGYIGRSYHVCATNTHYMVDVLHGQEWSLSTALGGWVESSDEWVGFELKAPVQFSSSRWIFWIPKWLVVSTFAVFYGALKWVCRLESPPLRSLIKPVLFWVARIGLGLCVVVWIVGQWRQVSFLLPLPSGTVGAELVEDGWTCSHTHTYVLVHFGNFAFERENFEDEWRGRDLTAEEEETYYQHTYFGPNEGDCVSIPHWFIITLATLFYGVLQWVYRKRPEAQPCED